MAIVEQPQRTILLVDDDPDVLNFVSRVLADARYRALTAESGAAALQQSKDYQGEIPLLLSDFQMPVMSGIELATKLSIERPQLEVLRCPDSPAECWCSTKAGIFG